MRQHTSKDSLTYCPQAWGSSDWIRLLDEIRLKLKESHWGREKRKTKLI